MDWKHLLFSFQGRVNRAKYWLVILLSIVVGMSAVMLLLIPHDYTSFFFFFLLAIAFLMWIGVAIGVKRLHDRDKSGWWLALYYFAPSLLSGIGELASPSEGSTVASAGFELVLTLIGLAISVWAIIDLGFLKGTQGPNRYGPDPLGATMADAEFEV